EQILENLPIGLNVVGKDLKLLKHNSRFRELLGFPKRELAKWKTFEDVTRFNAQRGEYGPGEVKKIVAERVRQVRKPEARHYERMRPDGTWIEVRGNPLPQGGFITTFSDVTSRKKAEEALRLSEERHRDLVEGSLQGLIIQRNFKPLFVNQAAAKIFGYESPKEILALGINLDLLAPHERRRVRDYARRRLSGQEVPTRYEVQGLRKNGSVIWIEVLNRVVNWDGRPAVQATITDISERKRAVQDLQENERLLQTVVNSIPHSVFVKDRRGRYLLVNKALARSYGKDPAEFVGGNVEKFAIGTGPEQRILNRTDRQVIRTGQPLEIPEMTLRMPNGEVRFRRVIKTPLVDDSGKVIGLVGISEDITERKKAEDERRASERLLQAVFDVIPHSIFVKDRKSRYLMVNSATGRQYNIDPAEFRNSLTADHTFADAATVKNFLKTDRQVFRTGQPVDLLEEPLILKNGEKRYHHVIKLPLRDDNGKVIGLVGLSEDITERKQAQDQLRSSERLLQTVLDTIPHGVFVKDRESRYIMVNAAMAERYGRQPQDFPGVSTLEIMPGPAGEREFRVQKDRQVLETGQRVDIPEFVVTMPTGEKQVQHIIKLPLRDESGEVIGIVGLSEDITERKKAEDEIQAGRRLLETIFDTIPHFFHVRDPQSRYLMVNRAMADFFNLRPEDFLGAQTTDLPAGTAEERRASVENDRRVLKTGKPVEIPEEVITRPDGGQRFQRVIKMPLRNESGKIIGIVSLAEDITERKRAEEALRRSQEQLRNIITNLPIMVWAVNKHETYTLSEGQGLASLGLKPGEVVGKSVAEVFPEVPGILKGIRRVLAGEPVAGIQQVAGQVFQVHLSPDRSADGEVTGLFGVAIDVTERAKIQSELEANQRLLKTVFDGMPIGLIVKDREGRNLMTNRALSQFVDLLPEDYTSLATSAVPYYSADEKSAVLATDRQVLETGEMVEIPEVTYTGSRGSRTFDV
ncbi:MAG: PAS domain-containing protein, partial [SAR324 cluster bacterium]|nr:PAS domain-containing protein [SAR324 cluster bacterium]